MKKLSWIAENIPASPIRELVPFAEAAKKRGVKIYHLNIGDPDIESPSVMIEALKTWPHQLIPYANSQGESHLINSLLGYYGKLGFGKLASADLQITLGGSEGLLWTISSICEPGDEILTFEPFYTNYMSFALRAGAKLVPIETTIETGFHSPKASVIEKKITERTKAILVCNPSNPTGAVYPKVEMDMLLGIAKKHGLYIIADEVYREFAYDGHQPYSVLNYLTDYPEGIILVDSLSKRYSLCGARLGVIVSLNKKLMQAFLRYGQARLSAGSLDQYVAGQLDKVSDAYFQKLIKEYDQRRQVLVNGLRKIPGVVCSEPEGAFYIMAKLPVKDSKKFAQWLLTDFSDDNETVMVAPAAGFYATKGLGVDEVRIAYVLNIKALERAVVILARALEIYPKN